MGFGKTNSDTFHNLIKHNWSLLNVWIFVNITRYKSDCCAFKSLTRFLPIFSFFFITRSTSMFHFIRPENVRKPTGSDIFSGYRNGTLGRNVLNAFQCFHHVKHLIELSTAYLKLRFRCLHFNLNSQILLSFWNAIIN